MQRAVLFIMLIVLAMLTGCASGVSRTKTPDKTSMALSPKTPLGSLELVMTESGKDSVRDNLKFDPIALKDHVQRALLASSLLTEDNKGDLPNIIIEVKDVRVRSNFSAVMWGFMAGNDHITGDIVIQDPAGAQMDRFEVSVSYALGGLAGGMDSARMGWLYETFAAETVKELTKNSSDTTVYLPSQKRTETTKVKEEFVSNKSTSNTDQVESRPKDNDDFGPGDHVLLEFNDGTSKIIEITSIDDKEIAGDYDYEGGKYKVSDVWETSTIASIKHVRISEKPSYVETAQKKPQDIFKPGDYILLEFKNGTTKELELTYINEMYVSGHYEYSFGKTTPISYDLREIKSIKHTVKDPNKKDFKYDL